MKMIRRSIVYGKHKIEFDIVRRERKTLEIGVEPDASVIVAAPVDASLAAIEQKVRKRAAWIQRQRGYFIQFQPRTPERQFLAGETHLYLGRHYRLKVIQHSEPRVTLIRGFIIVRVPDAERTDITRKLVESWYHERAVIKFWERLEINLGRFPIPEEFRPRSLIIRQSSKRWGSMSPASRLMLNRKLIEAPLDSIDYVITHELCHIAVPHHGPEFYNILNRVMPDWRRRKQRLEERMA